jgi:hypothetical protein
MNNEHSKENKESQVPLIYYVRLADHVAELMQQGLLDGGEFYGLYSAMEEVDPYWRTR